MSNEECHEFMRLQFLTSIGMCHVRIGDGVSSRLQLSGLLADMCATAAQAGGAAK